MRQQRSNPNTGSPRGGAGFTLIEMAVASAMFAAGALYIYATFAGITRSSQSATIALDLNSENKRALTALYNEIQASSLATHDINDSGTEVAVFTVDVDAAAPLPRSQSLNVDRSGATIQGVTNDFTLGEAKEQARERNIGTNSRLRMRKVIGFRFQVAGGTISPEWSQEVTFRVNQLRQLVRSIPGRPPRIISNHVDAFEVRPRPDGTVIVTLVNAKRNPNAPGFIRYANAVTVHPKN